MGCNLQPPNYGFTSNLPILPNRKAGNAASSPVATYATANQEAVPHGTGGKALTASEISHTHSLSRVSLPLRVFHFVPYDDRSRFAHDRWFPHLGRSGWHSCGIAYHRRVKRMAAPGLGVGRALSPLPSSPVQISLSFAAKLGLQLSLFFISHAATHTHHVHIQYSPFSAMSSSISNAEANGRKAH